MENKLIIGLSKQKVTQHPWFIKLYDQLLKLRSPSESSELDQQAQTSILSLRNTRKYYTEVSVLYDVMVHCLSFYSANEVLTSENRQRNRMLNDISEALSLIELQNYVTVPVNSNDKRSSREDMQDQNSNLFCISKESLQTKAKAIVTQQHIQVLKMVLEDYLAEQSAEVISFTFPNEAYLSNVDGMVAVVEHVQKLKKDTNEKRVLVAKQRQRNSTLISLVFHQLSEYVSALETLVSKYRLSQDPVLHLEYISISLKAYFLKLKFMELDILTKTYTSDSVPALKRLNEELQSRENKMKHELSQLDYRLSAYEGLDYKFQELLKEYAGLQKDIQFFQSSVTQR